MQDLTKIKLSAPAHRALAGAGIATLPQLAMYTEKQVAQLHGMGPKVITLLKEALAANGLSFATE